MSSSRITAASNTNQTFIGVASNDWVMNANTNQSVWIGTVNNANPTQSNYLVIGPTQTQTSNLKVLSQLDLTGAKVIGLTGINSNQAFSNIYTSNSFNSNLTATGQINFTGATFTPNTIPSSAISGAVGVNSNQSFSNIYASNAAFQSFTASNGAYSNLNTSNLTITQNLTLAQGSTIVGFNGVGSNQSFSNVYTSNIYAANAAFSNITSTGAINASGQTITAQTFVGALTGNATTSSSCSGNSVTATNASGLSGTPNITVGTVNTSGITSTGAISASGQTITATTFVGALTGNATSATTASACSGNAVTATNASGLINTPPIAVGTVSASGLITANGGITSSGDINATGKTITALTFVGALTGNATTAGTCTGNAATATTASGLNGTPNITVGTVNTSKITSTGTINAVQNNPHGLVSVFSGYSPTYQNFSQEYGSNAIYCASCSNGTDYNALSAITGSNMNAYITCSGAASVSSLNVKGSTTLSNLTVTGTVTGISSGGGVSSNMSFSNVSTSSLSASSNYLSPVSVSTVTIVTNNLDQFTSSSSGSLPFTISFQCLATWYNYDSVAGFYIANVSSPYDAATNSRGENVTLDLGSVATLSAFSTTANYNISPAYAFSTNNVNWFGYNYSGTSATTNTLDVSSFPITARYIKIIIKATSVRSTTINLVVSVSAALSQQALPQTLNINGPSGYLLDLTRDNARKLTTTTWATGSDERVKINVQDADTSICYSNVKSLKLKRFAWNSNMYPSVSDRNMLGWIAQDVKQVLPRSITYTNSYGFDDFHNLDTDQLIKSMYGAVQQLMSTVEKYGEALSNANIPIPQ